MLQYRIVVNGRVQGVGFRYFVQMEADKRKLAGWVKNRDDGRVEILAEGPENALQSFLEAVKKGSPFSNVTDVSVTESRSLEGHHRFSVVYS
ncbi:MULTISPECIES: acylphosphatase [Bacillus]|uniref:Acylphosphatase n=2 Tax=Bacillus inaquosorum TaxID=483913 RepID=A0A9Q4ERW7_9BACI|nr:MULTISPECIES: acylphosphatase [Bacillus]MDZ5722535.1 acylphosphatase [Bacillus sp. SXabc123]PPA34249.1 acylphosphatase [Bacillus subtilis]AMA51463.1 acylphosphatase [Bacillus inaquosorum]MBT2191515.1 acylphosphatase [Bacillus inaquosorum]MBT3117737.1 acylphosphatase [Bacillus inaquosorum]